MIYLAQTQQWPRHKSMELTEDSPQGDYQIKAYEPGIITINETQYCQSLILTRDTLITDWPPQNLSELQDEHLQAILNLKPSVILLGTGKAFQLPPTAQLARLYKAGFGVESMDTGAACRTFCALSAEGRNVVAALLID